MHRRALNKLRVSIQKENTNARMPVTHFGELNEKSLSVVFDACIAFVENGAGEWSILIAP